MMPSQYIHFSEFSQLGTVGKWYIKHGVSVVVVWVIDLFLNLVVSAVYNHCNYIEVLATVTRNLWMMWLMW